MGTGSGPTRSSSSHQASSFYGVASTVLGGGRVQHRGPETGLHERATVAEICAYYGRILSDRMLASGRVEFFPGSEYVGDGRVVSRVSGQRFEVAERCRIVDARYLAPDIPAETPPPFTVADGARVIPVNDLPTLEQAPTQWVVVGSGKTATDACIWLLARGVDPDRICWVRPREPWMLNRAVVQPDPAVFIGMAADTLEAAAAATSLDDVFLRLEDAGVMLRIDRTMTPTMARAPTLATWELDQLRSIEHVVRLGHVRRVDPGLITLDEGSVGLEPDAVVVHCAASGLQNPPLVPVWGRERSPCSRSGPGSRASAPRSSGTSRRRATTMRRRTGCARRPAYGNTLADWAAMNVRGTRASMSYSAEPDIKAWADGVALNPARVPTGQGGSAAVQEALHRLQANVAPGLARLAELGGVDG